MTSQRLPEKGEVRKFYMEEAENVGKGNELVMTNAAAERTDLAKF